MNDAWEETVYRREVWPWGWVTVDRVTGMPAVPEEGMFWRVLPADWMGFSTVQLRKKTWYGSRKVEKTYHHGEYFNKLEVLSDATYVLRMYLARYGLLE